MQLCIANLLGHPAPHQGQVPLAGGRPVRNKNGRPGVVFKNSPEAESFARWQRGQFHELERDTASAWRAMLSSLNLPEVARRMQALGITRQTCKTINDAYRLAAGLVHSRAAPDEQIGLLFSFVHLISNEPQPHPESTEFCEVGSVPRRPPGGRASRAGRSVG